jgi:hypothetical protein
MARVMEIAEQRGRLGRSERVGLPLLDRSRMMAYPNHMEWQLLRHIQR